MQSTIKYAVDHEELCAIFSDAERARVHLYASNIVDTFERATPHQKAAGLYWYDEARGLAARVAREAGISLQTAAAVIAVLSPSVSWSNQVNYTLPFVEAVLAGADARKVKGPFYGTNKEKAARILAGDFTALRGVKVEMFYQNILGKHDVATVDRHALRIAVGADLSPDECSAWLQPKNRKRLEIVAAYHLAARRLGYAVALVQAVTWVVFRGKAD
jgi:hypothetical protein